MAAVDKYSKFDMLTGTWVFLLLFVVWQCYEAECNVNEFGRKIVTITENVLGTKRFKAHMHAKGLYRNKPLHGDSVVKKLARNVNDKISSRENAVKRLQRVVTNAYRRNHWGRYKDCCSYSQDDFELSYDTRFLGKVSCYNGMVRAQISNCLVLQNLTRSDDVIVVDKK